MTDVHTTTQRSRNMSAIKGKGNQSTEIAFLRLLKKNKITGWLRHYRFLRGKPDFVFVGKKIAIFIDGCFWHGCPKCKLEPVTNKRFWAEKISINKKRDVAVSKEIKKANWLVLRFWEHQIKKNPKSAIKKLKKYLN
ncbi:MAG: very short patch repair endonuclease [Candidatus Nealsonbacteria bacterium]